MNLQIFSLGHTRDLGRGIARHLGQSLAALEERDFEDGEHKARPLESVQGKDAYVVHSLHGEPDQSPNDKLCRLLFLVGALKTNGAARVTAVVPYLAYARKDRQSKPYDPLNAPYVARMFEALGVDRVITMEVHNLSAFQNAFRCQTVALDTRGVLLERAITLAGTGAVTVASPDPGGVKRAQLFREALEERLGRPVGFALMEKRRSGGNVTGSHIAGDIEGARVLVIDDIVASGGTMVRAARALRDNGARDVWALAAHGLFTGGADQAVADSAIAGWVITDTVPPFRLSETMVKARVEIISAAPILAETIQRLHENRDVTGLAVAGS